MFGEVIHRVIDANPKLDCGLLALRFDEREAMWVLFVEKLATQPTVTPRIMDAQGGMNPEAGVAATRPEIQPEHCVERSQHGILPKKF